ncbi:MAG: class I tRNA ligase family protein [Deltaproteobacteria bacterium]|nr:class I tRNA ligase family protein [Deltaproteobacteria bacterium]
MATYSPSLSLESKFYQSDQADPKIYDFWERNGVFTAHPESSKPPFSVVIPPPNVTGRLHMGHALNNIVQDAVIRFKRMDGYDCLWLPGTDHAGISTQSVMKKQLDAQGINYRDLGREGMIAKIWEWREKYGDQILLQLKRLGCSCDWTRTRFTMDERFSLAVLVAFKRLYDDGLIYRGKYIVNWCPLDRTAISDEEVITAEGGEPGHLWYIRYKLSDGSGHVTVATTRPETMLGDSAVAVNPKDKRYAHLIGKMLRLPLSDREIPIIGDDYVDPEYGTGCLKVTPAHDPNDFQIGLRHGLPQINVMNEDATIGDQAPAKYHGLDRFVCRDQVVQELNALGLLEKVEDQPVPVGRAQRSKVIIEYRLSDQWFMRMQPLAKQALDLMDRTGIGMYPERWGAVFRQWLVNTRDWCISRQIWWGHRIPAWHHIESGEILVDVETPPRVKAAPQ